MTASSVPSLKNVLITTFDKVQKSKKSDKSRHDKSCLRTKKGYDKIIFTNFIKTSAVVFLKMDLVAWA